MAYTPNTTWEDAPSTDTPITAAALNHMEAGIVEGAQAASTSQAGNVELATSGEMTTGTSTTLVPPVSVVAGAIAALTKSSVGLGNVDNTSDTTKWAAGKTLTNTTIDFDTDTTGNTAENIPQEAVTGLTSALDAIGASGLLYVAWNASTETYSARSTSGTSDPDVPVLWIRGPGPAISGTGSTGACVGDLWLRAI